MSSSLVQIIKSLAPIPRSLEVRKFSSVEITPSPLGQISKPLQMRVLSGVIASHHAHLVYITIIQILELSQSELTMGSE